MAQWAIGMRRFAAKPLVLEPTRAGMPRRFADRTACGRGRAPSSVQAPFRTAVCVGYLQAYR